MIESLPPQGDQPAAPLASVTLLRPIRTLTIARDLGFRQRAVTVLGNLGPTAFAVAALDRPAEVVALVLEQQADVVVLDVTVSAAELAQVVVALLESAPRVGVVAVSDQTPRAGHALPVLAKWGWATELSQAAQDAYRRGNPLKEELTHVRHR